jgi:hypothetical protein
MTRSLVLASGIAVGTASSVAFAQQPPSAIDLAQARQLLNQGLKLRDGGDVAGALEKFKAARALAETPITSTELGRAYMALGKLVEAREAFLSVARLPRRPEETDRSTAARGESAQLAEQVRARIPSLVVKVTGIPADSVTVAIDGESVPAEARAEPRLLDPGAHDVLARSTDGRTAEMKVNLKEGEARDAELKIVPAASPPPPDMASSGAALLNKSVHSAPLGASPVDSGYTQRVTGLVLGGAGLLGLGASGVLGLVAKSQDNAAAAEPFPAKHNDSVNAWHLATTATIVAGVSGAFVLGGVVVWFTQPQHGAAVGTNGNELLVRGTF